MNSRFIADRIAGSRLIEPATGDNAWFHWYGRAPAILEEVGRLLKDVRKEQASFDRVLATVLFTDIVDSTATAATMGDARWRALLEEHDRIAKAIIGRFRGIYVGVQAMGCSQPSTVPQGGSGALRHSWKP